MIALRLNNAILLSYFHWWVFVRHTGGDMGNSTTKSMLVGSNTVIGWGWIEGNIRALMGCEKGKG